MNRVKMLKVKQVSPGLIERKLGVKIITDGKLYVNCGLLGHIRWSKARVYTESDLRNIEHVKISW